MGANFIKNNSTKTITVTIKIEKMSEVFILKKDYSTPKGFSLKAGKIENENYWMKIFNLDHGDCARETDWFERLTDAPADKSQMLWEIHKRVFPEYPISTFYASKRCINNDELFERGLLLLLEEKIKENNSEMKPIAEKESFYYGEQMKSDDWKKVPQGYKLKEHLKKDIPGICSAVEDIVGYYKLEDCGVNMSAPESLRAIRERKPLADYLAEGASGYIDTLEKAGVLDIWFDKI